MCVHSSLSVCSVVVHKTCIRNGGADQFLTISLLSFNTVSACISKREGKKTQFSELYLCNCAEKIGKMGFVLAVFLVFVFGRAKKKNLQGVPLCQLKYDEAREQRRRVDAVSRRNRSTPLAARPARKTAPSFLLTTYGTQ